MNYFTRVYPEWPNEVLVYIDYCPDCMLTHKIEHHYDGSTRCEVTVINNPAYYGSHRGGGIYLYRVRHSAGLDVRLPLEDEAMRAYIAMREGTEYRPY
jgi:hypothetical protein